MLLRSCGPFATWSVAPRSSYNFLTTSRLFLTATSSKPSTSHFANFCWLAWVLCCTRYRVHRYVKTKVTAIFAHDVETVGFQRLFYFPHGLHTHVVHMNRIIRVEHFCIVGISL